MAVYIDVIVDISVNSLDRIFQYRVPEELLDAVTVGCQVNVPFGSGNRRCVEDQGYFGSDESTGGNRTADCAGRLDARTIWLYDGTGTEDGSACQEVSEGSEKDSLLPCRQRGRAAAP